MQYIVLRAPQMGDIKFRLYVDEAPVTVAAFCAALPITVTMMHARVSGEEIWSPDGPKLDIIQENASTFAVPGEMVMGPLRPARVKTAGCVGIYYGAGRGLDAANIFAKVVPEDADALWKLGDDIWRSGPKEVVLDNVQI